MRWDIAMNFNRTLHTDILGFHSHNSDAFNNDLHSVVFITGKLCPEFIGDQDLFTLIHLCILSRPHMNHTLIH